MCVCVCVHRERERERDARCVACSDPGRYEAWLSLKDLYI